MNFDEILKVILESINNNTSSNGYSFFENKLDICNLSSEYIGIQKDLKNLSKIEYSTNSYILHPLLIEFINNYIKEKVNELNTISVYLSEKLILDYRLIKNISCEYDNVAKKDINIQLLYDYLKKLSEEEIKRIGLLESDIYDLKKYINECGKFFNNNLTFESVTQNILYLIVKRIINILINRNKFSTLKQYNLDIVLLDSIIDDDYCELSKSLYQSICGFVVNNKNLFLKENTLNEINSKIDLYTYDEDFLGIFPRIIEDKSNEKTIRNNKQRLSLMINRMLIYNSIYKKYGINAIKKADDINNLIFLNYYPLLADKLNLDEDEDLEDNPYLIQKIVKVDKTLPNIIYDNDYLSNNIINDNMLNLIQDIFDPNGQFKDLTDIELVNILLDIFICDDKLKYVDDNKYKDLSNKIKTIINKRNKG